MPIGSRTVALARIAQWSVKAASMVEPLQAVVELAAADSELSCKLANRALQLLDSSLLRGQQNLKARIYASLANAGNLSTPRLAGARGLDPLTKFGAPIQEAGRHGATFGN